jgi:hypothetical protein
LHQQDIDGLVVIGGNGTQTGAAALAQMGFCVAGAASTIYNDLAGSDITIGVDTALNIALTVSKLAALGGFSLIGQTADCSASSAARVRALSGAARIASKSTRARAK